jgi:hypothetical protein
VYELHVCCNLGNISVTNQNIDGTEQRRERKIKLSFYINAKREHNEHNLT